MISRRECKFAIMIALAAILLQQIPYALGYAFARAGTEYQGLLVNVEDFSYHAIMLQGFDGAWQYHIQFTSEEHAPAFIYGFYLALGHLARGLGISVIAMWHAARIASAFALFLATFAFIAQFIRDERARRVAYLLALFGAGFDWILFPWESLNIVGAAPIDFRMPEAHLFYSALTYPHYSIAIVLILGVFWFAQSALNENRIGFAMAAGICNLALVIVYPFLIYLTASVLGVYWFALCVRAQKIQWRAAYLLFSAFIFSLPLLLYYAFVLQTNSVLKIWNAQATTLSPNPLHYFFAYGAMIAMGIASLRATQGSEAIPVKLGDCLVAKIAPRNDGLLLWIWVLVVGILLYAPLNAQRRFVEGVQIPLAILATIGLFEIILPRLERARAFAARATRPRYSRAGLRRLLLAAFVSIISLANVAILARLTYLTVVEQPDAFFRARDEIAAVDWLRANASRAEIVLAAYWTGSFIPARAGTRVFVGQRYETVDFEKKMETAQKFFDAASDDAWRRALLAQNRIALIFQGPRERALGAFDFARADYLERAYANDTVIIYKVK
ncbi:MAG: hypothetical protein HY070_05990 [Chloroflexi bacterium]|nr:hypothetical protein [Chloroflexota bacterium]